MKDLIFILNDEYNLKLPDLDLLETALTHPSYGENYVTENYQRLEFLGDSIIKAILSEWLYNTYPIKDEGFYTESRIKMENGKYLISIAEKISLGMYAKKGNSLDFRNSPGVLADIFEALVGCIFLQNGYIKTSEFVIQSCTEDLLLVNHVNYMKEVNEYVQAKYKDNVNIFNYLQEPSGEWICFIDDEDKKTSAFGRNKKVAKENACREFFQEYLETV